MVLFFPSSTAFSNFSFYTISFNGGFLCFFFNVKTQRVFPILFTASSYWIGNGCHVLTILVERLLLQFPILIKQYRLGIIKIQNEYFTIMWAHY